MQNDNTRNTIIFVVSAVLIMILYQVFYLEPASKRAEAARAQEQAVQAAQPATTSGGAPAAGQAASLPREAAVGASPRARIDTPSLSGSVSLRGARIDDLFLKNYRQSVDKRSPPVELLRPEGVQHAWFADIGWTGQNLAGVPNADTVWTLVSGDTLAPGKPLVLRTQAASGLTFTRTIEVDEEFMFSVTDTVANLGGAPVTLTPYGQVLRQGLPEGLGRNQIVHEGAIGWLDDELRLQKYKAWREKGGESYSTNEGWVGITDKYWLTALAPQQGQPFKGEFRLTRVGGVEIYDANFVGRPVTIAPGRQITATTHFFAGAKTVPLLQKYQKTLGIPELDRAVDWGFMFILTRPMFYFLEFIYRLVGNFGIAILLLTVAVKLVFFPLANKSYESITKMKKVQPQVEELRKKFKDDPAKQQQELMALYQREKINPLTGCLPVLVQIPVFYALYKVLTVTIEMRHAPFFGWVRDLSDRDPTLIWNLFGIIPWDVAATPLLGGLLAGPLGIGAWASAYGFTMWLTTAMNPPAPDPVQQRMFQLMPLIFMFIMAPFAVGLLIYWTWSNVLSILQQYVIMRRFKVDNPIDRLLGKLGGKPKAVG
ncbi:MAG: membrane protein insertase YidC [Phenylobacterium sp.]|jgi:YidC/Oxa1 family membrane protein insertase|uniref:membrane protein insertase YidC n=1 Tax=Phenylobacterium sp. TaxID=1871053 RepID=UPI002A36A555|nr:membrane protein insertase YidC [Phenylobacterium sp.]MDX9998771.1 membrane protein insertase YidC [Phenylobacterium sp.]